MSTTDIFERELEELMVAKTRDFVFEDNIRRTITIFDAYWRWFDRFLASPDVVPWREEDFLKDAMANHRDRGVSLDRAFEELIVWNIDMLDSRGVNVAATKEERAEAARLAFKMIERMQMRREQAAEIEVVRRNLGLDDAA